MRLLEIQHNGTIALTEDLIGAGNVPAYAILSHTWLPGQEVTFNEFNRGLGRDKAGFDKIRFCTHLGDQHNLKQIIHEITNIPCPALAGASLDAFSVEDRLSWSSERQTTREEDKAYSLLGIFGVFTLLNYGEGETNAFKRLRRAIAEDSLESSQPQASAGSLGARIATCIPDNHDILYGTEQAAGIINYLPESEKGMTVFTTRVQDLAVSLTRGDVLELGSISKPDTTNFLEKTTITKYLRLLRHTEQDTISLISKEFRDQTRYKGSANAVASTWVVSFSQLRERDAMAADLLAFMSCIEWKAIPQSLLPKGQSRERMEEAIGTLCGYSFVSRRESDNTSEVHRGEEWYDLHRLVHLATRVWVDKYGSTADVVQQALAHISEIFPSDDYANQAVWRAYMSHALRLLNTNISVDAQSIAELSFQVGKCLYIDGRVPEAVRSLEECWRCREVLGEDDPDRLNAQHELGVCYQANGQIEDAVRLLEHVVKVRDDTLAETHPNRLASEG
ncbi:HET-domain-containing protein [Stemphylium lycopersici]|nr:HET-domain-containing protein [Stemphylium lycopersici]